MEPIKTWLGMAGNTDICESWIAGAPINGLPESALPETQSLIDHMACTTAPDAIDTTITVSDYKEFFGKSKECTSTSQDRHLGH